MINKEFHNIVKHHTATFCHVFTSWRKAHLKLKKLTFHQPVNDSGNKVKHPIDYLENAFERSEKQWMFHQSNGFKYTLSQNVWCGA